MEKLIGVLIVAAVAYGFYYGYKKYVKSRGRKGGGGGGGGGGGNQLPK